MKRNQGQNKLRKSKIIELALTDKVKLGGLEGR